MESESKHFTDIFPQGLLDAFPVNGWFSTPNSLGLISIQGNLGGSRGGGRTEQNELSPQCPCSHTSFLLSSQTTPCFKTKQQHVYSVIWYADIAINWKYILTFSSSCQYLVFLLDWYIECQKRKSDVEEQVDLKDVCICLKRYSSKVLTVSEMNESKENQDPWLLWLTWGRGYM